MNIIIFGGSGFIGSRTAQILKEQGHQVWTPDRRSFDFLHPDETAARRLLEGQDVLINCIGIMSHHAEILEPYTTTRPNNSPHGQKQQA